jgi:hypothetical protein
VRRQRRVPSAAAVAGGGGGGVLGVQNAAVYQSDIGVHEPPVDLAPALVALLPVQELAPNPDLAEGWAREE